MSNDGYQGWAGIVIMKLRIKSNLRNLTRWLDIRICIIRKSLIYKLDISPVSLLVTKMEEMVMHGPPWRMHPISIGHNERQINDDNGAIKERFLLLYHNCKNGVPLAAVVTMASMVTMVIYWPMKMGCTIGAIGYNGSPFSHFPTYLTISYTNPVSINFSHHLHSC